ncbi:CoA transferase subunit A [Bacillus sp. 2205SS5-2]|uniref:CoA transferase subunit A n=1 Tax=Bacillus sp. 2205SS5-2 TaxID=3109031 RepID=UPI003004F249
METWGKECDFHDIQNIFTDEMTLMFGGFGGVGSPPNLIDFILELGIKDLTIIGNDTGFPTIGIGKLVANHRVKKVVASHIGSNPIAGALKEKGEMEIEFSPQGILAERIRAGGVGLGGIVTHIGVDDPLLSSGKEKVVVNGQSLLVETALTADVSIVYSKKADLFGNLVYDKSARNTNPLVAMAGNITIAEVEEIVPIGDLAPEEIVTSGVFVNSILHSKGVTWEWMWEQTGKQSLPNEQLKK